MIWPSFEYIKQHREGREPWSSGYGRILMFQKSKNKLKRGRDWASFENIKNDREFGKTKED